MKYNIVIVDIQAPIEYLNQHRSKYINDPSGYGVYLKDEDEWLLFKEAIITEVLSHLWPTDLYKVFRTNTHFFASTDVYRTLVNSDDMMMLTMYLRDSLNRTLIHQNDIRRLDYKAMIVNNTMIVAYKKPKTK